MYQKPLCLVAHNGNRFDFPLLRKELFKANGALPEDILCVDSLEAFRYIHKASEEKELSGLEKNNCHRIIPEFSDGYDKLLIEAVEDIESSFCTSNQKPSVMEIKKANETTPKKKVINVMSSQELSSSINRENVESKAKKSLNMG